jgi:hypothetical protein
MMIMPSPEDIYQANRELTTVVAYQHYSTIGQHFKKLAGLMVEQSKQDL